MIGKTNCKAPQERPCEKVNINIQSDSTSFPGATFTVSYGSYSKTYTWDGSIMTIDIPAYVEYTISFDAVADFTTPASITNTEQAGTVLTVDVTYMLAVEKVTVNVSADEGEVSGFEVKIFTITPSLSDEYKQLEYIESLGAQYIDTGFKMNQDTGVVMKVKATSISSNAWAFEGRISSSSASKGVFFYNSSNKLWNVDYN